MKALESNFEAINKNFVVNKNEANEMSTKNSSIVELRNEIDNWNKNVYLKATDKLYELLGCVYDFYLINKENQSVIDNLKDELTNDEIKYSKNANFISLLSKYVFKNIDPKRVSAYKRVLIVAIDNNLSSGTSLANYIRQKGGIEKVRTDAAKNSLTMIDRSTSAKDQIKNHECIAEVKSDFFKSLAATGEDNIVVLVGYVDNNGTFQGKHAVFGEKIDGLDNIPSKNVIDAALSNMYASLNQSKKNTAQATTSELSVNDKIKTINNFN